jgi:hypothetical protein
MYSSNKPFMLLAIAALLVVVILIFSSVPRSMTPSLFVAGSNGGLVVTPAYNGYNVSNITKTYLYNITLNGSEFKFYINYISQNSTVLNEGGAIYALYLNKETVLIRNTSNYSFYVKLVNIIFVPKTSTPQSVTIYFYSVPNHPITSTTINTTSTTTQTTTIVNTTLSTSTIFTTTILQKSPVVSGPERDGIIILIILILIVLLYYLIKSKSKKQEKPKHHKHNKKPDEKKPENKEAENVEQNSQNNTG